MLYRTQRHSMQLRFVDRTNPFEIMGVCYAFLISGYLDAEITFLSEQETPSFDVEQIKNLSFREFYDCNRFRLSAYDGMLSIDENGINRICISYRPNTGVWLMAYNTLSYAAMGDFCKDLERNFKNIINVH